MRIVGGEWKGHPIEAPEGRDVTRPTTDRVREAVSSMLMSARGLTLDGASVLDAFAGSGALGLELLSRGAAHATFVDLDRGACARVRRNAPRWGRQARASRSRGETRAVWRPRARLRARRLTSWCSTRRTPRPWTSSLASSRRWTQAGFSPRVRSCSTSAARAGPRSARLGLWRSSRSAMSDGRRPSRQTGLGLGGLCGAHRSR